jgi:hypothetical protein
MQLASSKLHADQKYMESIYEHWQSDSTQDHLTHRKAAEATESFLKICMSPQNNNNVAIKIGSYESLRPIQETGIKLCLKNHMA